MSQYVAAVDSVKCGEPAVCTRAERDIDLPQFGIRLMRLLGWGIVPLITGKRSMKSPPVIGGIDNSHCLGELYVFYQYQDIQGSCKDIYRNDENIWVNDCRTDAIRMSGAGVQPIVIP